MKRGRVPAMVLVLSCMVLVGFAEENDAPRVSAPRVSEGEREGSRVTVRRISGTVESRQGNTLTLVQRGDGGTKSHTVDLGNAPILVETDEYETVTGGEGGTRQQRKFVAGNRPDLEDGRRVSVTTKDGVVSEIRVYLPKKKREGGEG